VTETVITAIAAINALGSDLGAFARGLRTGRSAITSAGARLPAAARTTAGAWLDGFDGPDWPGVHGFDETTSRTLLKTAGRCAIPARTAVCVAQRAVTDARLSTAERDRTALIVAGNNLGLGYQARALAAFERGVIKPSHALTCLDTDAIGAISECAGIHAEAWTVGAASASGTVAVLAAARLIAAGQAEHCLVVAPMAELSAAELRALRDSGAMAHSRYLDEPHRLCRPFDRDRQGLVYGQGAAAVLVESAPTAARRARRPLARILGGGQYLDARRGTEPDPAGQANAMGAALDAAGLAAREVTYVNAHATGSAVGDPAEAAALRKVFGRRSRPVVNATKALIGHCMSGAGLQELIATLIQMTEGFVHPNPNLDEPIDDAPELAARTAEAARIDVAMSNSFAFSGINASVVLGRPGM
jgi:malonyl-ACP decarboxylase